MNVFLRIDINIAAMVLLGAVLVIAHKHLDKQDRINRLFLNMSSIIILEMFFEAMTCIINRRPEHWLIPVTNILHICLFVTGPFLTYSWYIFMHSWVAPLDEISRKKHIIMLIPAALNSIITLLSPIYGFVFSITDENIYRRGPLFPISSVVIYFYIVYSLILIIVNKRKIVKQEFLPLVVFGFLPIIGGVLQSVFYGTLLMWSSAAFSLVIVHDFLQRRMIHKDSLTGAWTRGSFDYYIAQRVKHNSGERFGVVFIDLDKLKHINDEYGHYEGDYAIKTSVDLIKSVLRRTDVLARLGGDEFVIIVDCQNKEDLDITVGRINAAFERYNSETEKDYKLECSFGADIFNSDNCNIEQFLHHVDHLMYIDKKQKD